MARELIQCWGCEELVEPVKDRCPDCDSRLIEPEDRDWTNDSA